MERPLRLNFQVSPERIARLDDERAFVNLAVSKKRGKAKEEAEAAGRDEQEAIRQLLSGLEPGLVKDRAEFEQLLTTASSEQGVNLAAPIKKAVLSALSERDASATICRDKDGQPEPDPELRDTESIPLSESIDAFFDREVKPHLRDAWIDRSKRDEKDGEVGIVGYEVNFNRYFDQYVPPRPLEAIEADIRKIEQDIVRMLAEVTGSN